jgi:hypothetical protein
LNFQVILHTAAGAVTFEDCGKDDIDEWYIIQFQKEQYHEIFYFRFIFLIIFPHDSDIPKSAILNFLTIREDIRNSRCTSLPVIPMEIV